MIYPLLLGRMLWLRFIDSASTVSLITALRYWGWSWLAATSEKAPKGIRLLIRESIDDMKPNGEEDRL